MVMKQVFFTLYSLICFVFLTVPVSAGAFEKVVALPSVLLSSDYKAISDLNDNSIFKRSHRKVVLRKNIVDGANTLTQDMISEANKTYIVRYDFVLGEDIVMPPNCILKFKGGSFAGGKIKGNNTFINNKRKVVFKDIVLEGDYSGEIHSSWFKNDDDDDTFSSVVLFDKVFIESNLYLNRLQTPITHKSTCIQGVNNPVIYTDFDDDNTNGNGVNVLRISTPMGVEEVSLIIKNLSIIDIKYNPAVPLVKPMSSGVYVFPHDPNTKMTIKLENLFVKTRGDSFGFSHEQEDHFTYDGIFYLYVDNCDIESGEFCVETYKPGNVKEMHFNNSHFVSTHSFRPELSLGTHAVAGQDREAHIYINNCTFDKGLENGIHEYASNPNTKYLVFVDDCVFNKYHYINEYNVHRAGEGVEIIANNCVFKNECNSTGGASGGDRIEFNDCVFQLSYTGDEYGLFAGKTNIFRRCYFDCNKMIRFFGNYRNGSPLLYNSLIFDNCVFNNTTVVVGRFEESAALGMQYIIKDCRFIGESSIRHWNTTEYDRAKRFYNTETSPDFYWIEDNNDSRWNKEHALESYKKLIRASRVKK